MPTPPQDATPELRKQDKLLKKRHRAEDAIIKLMTAALLTGSEELSARIQRRIMRLDLDSQGNVKQTDKNLREMEKITQLLDQGATLITNQAIRGLKSETESLNNFYMDELKSMNSGLPNDELARIPDKNQTNAVLNTNLDNMKAVKTSFVQEVRRQLKNSLFENIGPEEIAARTAKFLEGTKDKKGNPMTRHAPTLARTAYNAYANALTLQNVNLDEVVAYYYSGPDDLRTRTFCRERVGKTIAKETLESDIQGQSGGSLHNAGGFNCRHKLFPVSMFDDEAGPFLNAEQKKIVSEAEEGL
ncbi:MAG: hypothetical protein VX803_12085 [Pseudomonadota bacterium]|nr:hypothetical protein [Pseudomonadota bacterium]